MLSDVTILITTFMRPGYLTSCVNSIFLKFPCPIAVACDDEITPRDWYVKWMQLPFDSGLTAKRNATVAMVDTKYALLGCDDFDFSTFEGLADMVSVLEENKEVDVVVGRVNNKEYEGWLEYVPGEYIKEHRLKYTSKIDIGINFFLARTQVLRDVPWDENIRPIGGEHADWFLSMKEGGKFIVSLPTANINTLPYNPLWMHPDYMKYRRRAHLGHELFLKKRGVKRYYSFDEEVR